MNPPTCRLPRSVWVELAPLVDATDGTEPLQATRVKLRDRGDHLDVRFDCDDLRPWATLERQDADLWTEEVVELFLAPGIETPRRYVEIEVNPLGTRFAALVASPHGDRRGLTLDRSWDSPGLDTRIARTPTGWQAALSLAWAAVPEAEPEQLTWRANFLRIDRPAGSAPEFSAWSPTLVEPADFHRPQRFGFLQRVR